MKLELLLGWGPVPGKKCSLSILAARLLVIHCEASGYGSVRCLTALNRFQSAIQTTSTEVERTIKLF